MAYATPGTVAAGDVVTASAWNVIANDLIDHETRIAAGEAAWTTFTPSWGGITIGNGTNDAAYMKVGKHVTFRATFTLGSTSAITAAGISFVLPFNGKSVGAGVFSGLFVDTGTQFYQALIQPASVTTLNLYASTASGAYVNAATTSSTIPFTWVSTDVVMVGGVYEAA